MKPQRKWKEARIVWGGLFTSSTVLERPDLLLHEFPCMWFNFGTGLEANLGYFYLDMNYVCYQQQRGNSALGDVDRDPHGVNRHNFVCFLLIRINESFQNENSLTPFGGLDNPVNGGGTSGVTNRRYKNKSIKKRERTYTCQVLLLLFLKYWGQT